MTGSSQFSPLNARANASPVLLHCPTEVQVVESLQAMPGFADYATTSCTRNLQLLFCSAERCAVYLSRR